MSRRRTWSPSPPVGPTRASARSRRLPDLVLSPNLSIQAFAQPLVSAGDYRTYAQLGRPSSFELLRFTRGDAVDVGSDVGCVGGSLCERDGRTYIDYSGDGIADTSFGERDFNVRSLRGSAVLRWEYRPGSRIYVAWQQRREDRATLGDFRWERDVGAMFSGAGEHFLMIKVDYWLDL